MVETIVAAPQFEAEGRCTEAMDIEFNCPKCNETLVVDQSAAGAAVDCPTCSEPLVVPAKSQIRQTPPPPPRKPPVVSLPAEPPPAQPAKRAKGLAVWSLVLGIVGLVPVVGLATGLIGSVLGTVALFKRTTSKGVAVSGTVLGIIATCMIPFHLLMINSATAAARFSARNVVCINNLKTIGVGIAQYQQRHGGSYPPSLNALVAEKLIPAGTLSCPLHGSAKDKNDYEYVLTRGAPAQGYLVWDRYPHRAGANVIIGRNALAADLSVRQLTEPQVSEISRTVGVVIAAPQKPQSAKKPGPSVAATPIRREPPPAPPAMTISNAIVVLKSAASDRDQRGAMQFLTDATVEPERRDDVIAAIKPLLNDVQDGTRAFDAFIKWAGSNQVPDLIEFVTVSPGSARGKQAMLILSRMGDARAASPLAACLAEFSAGRDAKAALAALGAIAKPDVLPLYHHENRGAREAARELLRGYKVTDEEILAESIRALGSENTETRHSAIYHFTTTTIPADQREAVARALRPLVTENKDRVGDVARNAMKKVATKADADFLLGLVPSTDGGVRWFAVDLLVDFKEPRAAKPLAALLADPHETWRAGEALLRFGSSAETAIIPNLKSADAEARKRAAEILAKIGTATSLPALESATKDKDFFAKAAAESARASIRARAAEKSSGKTKIGF